MDIPHKSAKRMKMMRLKVYRTWTMPAQLAEAKAALEQAESRYRLKCGETESLKVEGGAYGVLAQVKERIEPGRSVTPGTTPAKITNPKKLKAQLRIPEAQARAVRIGLAAKVDTHHGTFVGKVSRIDPTVREGNVPVDVSLDGVLPQGAGLDLLVVGTIEIERPDHILYVGRPVSASSEGLTELFKVVEEGRSAAHTRVPFDRSSVSTTEIRDGLNVGDEIVLGDMSQWDGCDRIRRK